jgi:hypothetical protein
VDLQIDADVSEKHVVSIFRGWSDKAGKQRATSLPCYFSPWRWGQHVYPKRRHRPANPHGAKTQYFYNNFLFWFSCKGSTQRTQLLGVLLKHYKVLPLFSSLVLVNVISSLCTANFRIYYSIPASRSSCVRTIVVKTFNFDKFRSGSYRDMWAPRTG